MAGNTIARIFHSSNTYVYLREWWDQSGKGDHCAAQLHNTHTRVMSDGGLTNINQ